MKNIKFLMVLVSILLVGLFGVLPQAVVQAQDSQTGFQVTQKVRNLTKQSFTWVDSLQADPNDRLEFQITITWRSSQTTPNVFARAMLAEKLVYVNNLKIDGSFTTGDITKENINIGAMTTGQTKAVTFEAQVAAVESFPAGTTNLVNVVTVFSADGGASVTSAVHVVRAGTPTQVPTGPVSVWMIGMALLFGAVFVGASFVLLRSYVKREVFESPYATRTDRKLATLIEGIKNQERK